MPKPKTWIDTPLGQIYAGQEDTIRKIIEQTTSMTVLKLKGAGLLRDERRTATEKTEELLRNYPTFREIRTTEKTRKLVEEIEEALESISGDPYADIIPRFYFDNESRESIALDYDTTPTTISRNKARLLQILATRLFTDDIIFELFI